tara:strand:+ start:4732 stop:5865 length:1134 start_codon:yes stop_codon:yes gene_type:complete
LIYFITYSEKFNGIYFSQVIDVCNKIQKLSNKKVILISLVSLRFFKKERLIIKEHYKNSFVIPMFPKIKFWKLNIISLIPIFLFTKNNILISRNAISTNLGFKLRKLGLIKKVIFDARAVEYEQFKEYKIVTDKLFVKKFFDIEKKAVLNSDFRLAISHELVNYWSKKFNFSKKDYTVIPSTLNSVHLSNAKTISRESLGFKKNDIIFVYSGSSSDWQSFSKIIFFTNKFLERNKKYKLLILANKTDLIIDFIRNFPNQILIKWFNPIDVIQVLKICDYGLLIREESITNQVASPVKFAEYLYAGLKIIISPNIGDYSKFVLENNCGYLDNNFQLTLRNLTEKEKKVNIELAINNFSKNSVIIENEYINLIKITNAR